MIANEVIEAHQAPAATRLLAEPANWCDVSDRTFARMADMAERFSLPGGTAWRTNRGTDEVSGLDAAFGNDLPERTFAKVGCIPGELEAWDVVAGLGLTKGIMGRDGWDPAHNVKRFYRGDETEEPHQGPETVAVWAQRNRTKAPEALLLCWRQLYVSASERGVLALRYVLHGEFAYVAPKARGRGLAAALVIAVGEQVDMDLMAIRATMDGLPPRVRPKLLTSVMGEAESEGGLWVLDRMHESVEMGCISAGFPGIRCDVDYGI